MRFYAYLIEKSKGPIPALESMITNLQYFTNQDILNWFQSKIQKLEKGNFDEKKLVMEMVNVFAENLDEFVSLLKLYLII